MERTIRFKGTKTKVLIKDDNEHIQRFWLRKKFYESERKWLFNRKGMLREVYKRSPKGGKFIDIGASIGNHSLFFANVMKGEVLAFEPFYPSFDHLLENFSLNHLKLNIYNVAIGAGAGKVVMERRNKENIGMIETKEVEHDGGTLKWPLDVFKDQIEGYDVIKIDVEKDNIEVLRGAKRILSEGTGDIYIEAENEENLKEIDAQLNLYGYTRVPGLVMNATATYLYTK